MSVAGGWMRRGAAALVLVGLLGTATFASTANIAVPRSHAGVAEPSGRARCIVHHVEIDCRRLNPTPTPRNGSNPHPIVTPHVGRAPVPVPSSAADPVNGGGDALP